MKPCAASSPPHRLRDHHLQRSLPPPTYLPKLNSLYRCKLTSPGGVVQWSMYESKTRNIFWGQFEMLANNIANDCYTIVQQRFGDWPTCNDIWAEIGVDKTSQTPCQQSTNTKGPHDHNWAWCPKRWNTITPPPTACLPDLEGSGRVE